MTMQGKIKETEGWPRKLLEKLVVLCLYKNEVGKGRERPHEFFFFLEISITYKKCLQNSNVLNMCKYSILHNYSCKLPLVTKISRNNIVS